ncbi:GreA/GreB family elongation factor [Streptomyces fructofermentans]|uniref:Transcription elongation factor GreA n=1 Tax=Streptomyces fructofermentans TaxID=152141 RepID=A0A918ND34_9ACTN|nr:GreA/GreB family elongation factor [Streptomyces fructofermentans]GGX63636.1 transcription elongation factor GreA [Streptomyces fructofermentans]
MTSEPAPISDAARRALEDERDDVRAERAKVAATLKDPDEVGDSADEADELQRADDLDRLDARIEEIDTRLRQAAEAGPPATDEVGIGSTVTVRFADGSVETVQIGAGAAHVDRTLVTADSPLGRALLGGKPGDSVVYDAPEGEESATVVSIGGPTG